MYKRVVVYLGTILALASQPVFAQGFVENALLFSRNRPGGSARIQGMGGSQLALGGDFSSALSNPAGLGMYNRSEFTLTPSVNGYTTEADHLSTETTSTKTKFTLPGISYVHHLPAEKKEFLGGAFAVSMTRINDFNQQYSYGGVDTLSSMVDFFLEDAQGFAIDPLPAPYDDYPLLNYDFPSGLSYLTFLINPFAEDPDNVTPVLPDDYVTYYSELQPLPGERRTLTRTGTVTTKGAQYQWSLAYGANFNDKFFAGATLGITTLRYTYQSTYGESDFDFSFDPSYNPLDQFRLNESIEVDGSGLNFTAGIIYRPLDVLQLGASVVTPTYYTLTDTYTATVSADWNDARGNLEESSLEPILSEYSLTTPMKFSAGAAFFLGGNGVITADLEFINYSNARYRSSVSEVSFDPENEVINDILVNVVNYRLGAEYRVKQFRLRAGYAVQQNPYAATVNVDQQTQSFSLGAGIRLQQFFTDLAWVTTTGNGVFSPYMFSDLTGPRVSLNNQVSNLMLTVGFTF